MQVNRSGYYRWLNQPLSPRAIEDQRLLGLIKHYWLASYCYYGYRNIHCDLKDAGESCGRDRVYRLMKVSGLQAQRGYKKPKHKCGNIHYLADNRLDRAFNVKHPNQWWVSDITYIRTHEGWLFVAVVMDLYARNIVGWSMQPNMTEDIVVNAFRMAYWRRKPSGAVNVHFDQGSQYTSRACQKALSDMYLIPSMSRKGNCWDNAVAESFFANMKRELIKRTIYKTRSAARQAIFNYIEMFYNPKRRHTHNGRIAPNEYEAKYFRNLKSV